MPRGRVIDNRIWQSEKVSKWDYFTRLLFVGMVTNADDQGRGRAHSNLLASTIFPYDGVSSDEIETALQKMVDSKAVIVYIPDGTPALYQIKKWWDYNTASFALPSKYPAPPDWGDRWAYKPSYGSKLHYKNWPGKVDTTVGTTVGTTVEDDQEIDQEIDLDLDQETDQETAVDGDPAAAADSSPRDPALIYGRLEELGIEEPKLTELAAHHWVTLEHVNSWWRYIQTWGVDDEARIPSLITRLGQRRMPPVDFRRYALAERAGGEESDGV